MNDELVTTIRTRYRSVLDRIAAAAARSGRQAESVRLVVVSKAQPVEVVRAARTAGIRMFGENYVEEALEKMSALRDNSVEWHMIGHLQSRKAGEVARSFHMLHSLDSLKLANRLGHFCDLQGKRLPVLLEFNVSGEQSKFGFPAWRESEWPSLEAEIRAITQLPGLQVKGLMTMPPYFDDPDRPRPFFRRLMSLQAFLSARFPQVEWAELSMGTSVDFIAAVEEGATLVRVGTAILGSRLP
jgi:pyridoxal phosphate enzyme (YggS family)